MNLASSLRKKKKWNRRQAYAPGTQGSESYVLIPGYMQRALLGRLRTIYLNGVVPELRNLWQGVDADVTCWRGEDKPDQCLQCVNREITWYTCRFGEGIWKLRIKWGVFKDLQESKKPTSTWGSILGGRNSSSEGTQVRTCPLCLGHGECACIFTSFLLE